MWNYSGHLFGMLSRKILRRVSTWVSAPLVVVLYLNIEKLAEGRGWDALLLTAWVSHMPTLLSLATEPWVTYLAVGVVAFTAGLWIDLALRKRESQPFTSSEVNQEDFPERILVPPELTPERLLNFYNNGLTNFQSSEIINRYYGKWIEVTGMINRVDQVELGLREFFPAVYMDIPISKDESAFISLYFNGFDNIERIRTLRQGDTVTIIGRICQVSPHYLGLDKCEFVG